MYEIAKFFNDSNVLTVEKLDVLYETVKSVKSENEKEFQELFSMIQRISSKMNLMKENADSQNTQVYFKNTYIGIRNFN